MRSVIVGVCTVAMRVLAQAAHAARGDRYFLQVPNSTGSLRHRGYAGWIALSAFSAGLIYPTESATGSASGRVSCQQVIALKPLDSSSPLPALDVATARLLPP